MKKQLTIAGGLLAALIADAADVLTRPELEKKLQELAKEPTPTKLAPGAMCYDMAMPAQRKEFVCPSCGKKTLYATQDGSTPMPWMLAELETYRRLVKQIQSKGIACKLDETAFCKTCGKDAKKKVFVLETTWAEKKTPHRAELKSTVDLQLVLEFLDGKKKHSGGQAGESPLKNYLPRIREVLGLLPAVSKKENK